MTRLALLIVLLFGLWLPAATAENATLNCDKAYTTADMATCAQRDYEAADAALNETYRDVMARLKHDRDQAMIPEGFPDPVKSLRNAQRAWIAYRDANCTWHYSLAMGGTIRSLYQLGCLTGMTQDRTKELRDSIAL